MIMFFLTITSPLRFLRNTVLNITHGPITYLSELLTYIICILCFFQYGPIFTVFAMGTRMTFVTEEEGINVFLKSKEVNFELAVQNPVYRTGKEYFQIVHLKYNIGIQE